MVHRHSGERDNFSQVFAAEFSLCAYLFADSTHPPQNLRAAVTAASSVRASSTTMFRSSSLFFSESFCAMLSTTRLWVQVSDSILRVRPRYNAMARMVGGLEVPKFEQDLEWIEKERPHRLWYMPFTRGDHRLSP
jgi:hypothetical protein